MIPQYQSRPNPNGDCIRASLASIFELPIESVPDFMLLPDIDREGYPNWYLSIQEFCANLGYALVEIQLEGQPWMPLPKGVLAIFYGPTENGSRHAIVGTCEGRDFIPVFDPLGGQNLPIAKVEAVCLLVPLDPMHFVRLQAALEEIERTSAGIGNRIVGDSIRDTAREALGKKTVGIPTLFGPSGAALPTNGRK